MTQEYQLKLDRQHLIQMANCPAFYAAVPAFEYLREVALQSWHMYTTNVNCQRCQQEWAAMQGVVDALFMKLQEVVAADDQETITAIKAFLSSRKGYTVSSVVLYYRRSLKQGKIVKFIF